MKNSNNPNHKGNLKQLRINKGLTQKIISEVLGVSVSHYSKLEGNFVNPSFKLLKRLKNFYGDEIDMNNFF